jgi:hypothetical protein
VCAFIADPPPFLHPHLHQKSQTLAISTNRPPPAGTHPHVCTRNYTHCLSALTTPTHAHAHPRAWPPQSVDAVRREYRDLFMRTRPEGVDVVIPRCMPGAGDALAATTHSSDAMEDAPGIEPGRAGAGCGEGAGVAGAGTPTGVHGMESPPSPIHPATPAAESSGVPSAPEAGDPSALGVDGALQKGW